MIVLPSLDETIQSNKSPDEICETLRAVTVSRGNMVMLMGGVNLLARSIQQALRL